MSDVKSESGMSESDQLAVAEGVSVKLMTARQAIGDVVFGQHEAIENTLVTLLAGGHALLVGVPGLAKTRLVETLGIVLGLDSRRVQFTPDLMPSDIIGSEVMEEGADGRRQFRFLKGPVFTRLLMADEINRASPRTQSALLQASIMSLWRVSAMIYLAPSMSLRQKIQLSRREPIRFPRRSWIVF